ncbi:DUF1254 domain-containing protein [Isosphaeraceae bacterium EP7]
MAPYQECPEGDTTAVMKHAYLQNSFSKVETTVKRIAVSVLAVGTLLGTLTGPGRLALAQDGTSSRATPGFNTEIPGQILTPDTLETRIGTLKFFDGLPTKETVQKVYDNLDFMRGVDVFLNFIPATSMEAIRRGLADVGVARANQAILFDGLMDSNSLFLTGNTDTVYCFAFTDLEKDGPTVVEIPPGCGPGTVNDAFFRFVTDMGIPGPDRGKGGKYLLVPESYKGVVPEGYIVAKTSTHVNAVILRGFLVDGKTDAASKMFKDGLKIYPLSKAGNPPPMDFVSGSHKAFNTVDANTFAFYEELNAVIQKEPIDFLDPELRGQAASIGIIKGKPFAPDERMKKLLTESVAVGNATARAIGFRNRDPRVLLYDNSQWKTGFIGGDYRWLDGDGVAGRDLDARTYFFYLATVNTPAMAAKMVGRGAQYAFINTDKDASYLDGGKDYRLHMPAKVPAKDFWSVVVYDPQTRSELQTGQPFPSKNNKRDELLVNADGSVDLYFGPKAPQGKEKNWTQTVAGKGWFALLRLYGPLEPWFDKTWRPGDIELVK